MLHHFLARAARVFWFVKTRVMFHGIDFATYYGLRFHYVSTTYLLSTLIVSRQVAVHIFEELLKF